MTGDQVRAARALLGWSRDRLGDRSDCSGTAIRVFEETERVVRPMVLGQAHSRMQLIRTALEAAGVVFTDGEEPGVKLRKAEG